ncbi:MAG: hypothetical protein MAG431_01875 [Chloroflexi bacterium]|nr:hypothetical protein [Chloroflexota bacterium]
MTTLTKQPNSKHCFVCGVDNEHGLHLKFYEKDNGDVVVNYTVPDHFQGYDGMTHGGIVATLVDETLGRVHMGPPDDTRFMVTAKLNITYRRPVPTGKPIKIVGHAQKSRRRSATSTAEIYGPGGELLVEAEALLVDVPSEMLAGVDLEELGWKVYPD